MRKIWKKVLAYVLVATMCLSTASVPAYAQESTAGAMQEAENGSTWDQVTTEEVFEGDNYRVTYTLTSHWDTGFNANVKVENTGESTIQSWYLGFDYNNSVSNIWNAEVYSNEGNAYVIKNAGWNQDIVAGNSIEFGLSGDHAFRGFPENYEILGATTEVAEADYTMQYKLYSDWGSGFSGEISIKNNTDAALEDWILEFDFEREITEIWNGIIEKHEGNRYVVRNAEYNSIIAPGASVLIGFNGCAGVTENEPCNYLLTKATYEDSYETDEELTITMNIPENMCLYEGIEGYLVVSKVKAFDGNISLKDSRIKTVEAKMTSGSTTVPQNMVSVQDGVWRLVEPQMLIGDNIFTVTVYSKDGRMAEFSTHIWNSSSDNINLLEIDENDNDKDGLKNYQEEQYGTDPNKEDTDGDGFTDIEEIFLLNTDPLVYNADEDNDSDGLSNKEELELNTDMHSADTDYDGLNDYDEIRVYGTNPKTVDTDNDIITDLVEIRMGTNPCVAEHLTEDGMVEVEYSSYIEGADVKATLDISLLPEQLESLQVDEVKADDTVLSGEIPGYLGSGSAYEFTLDGEFAKATLTFELSKEMLSKEGFVPGIYYYNEETQLLEELEGAVWDGNTISVELEHFSKYILLNKSEFDTVWQYNLHFDNTDAKKASLDIVFVIDSSGSMTSNDRSGIRKTVTKNFINKLTDNDRAAVVDFDDYASVYCEFTNDKEVLCNAVDRIDSSGGTSLSAGISAALTLFTSTASGNDSKQKCIIMLTDGSGSYSTSYTTAAKNQNITIYTVGLGSSVSTSVLKNMAEGTDGSYFPASEADKLYGVFDRIIELTDLYKDSDKDGVTDYHEKAMAAGTLRLGTGVSLLGMDYLDDDSDDDDILDGNEISVKQFGPTVYVSMSSNPTRPDTDGDGLNDKMERSEIKTNIGNHKLSPLKKDTDGDGLSDSEELGTFHAELGYYRVNSNPFQKEITLGTDGPQSFIIASVIDYPIFTKKKYSEGTLLDGRTYTVYTFTDTSTPLFTSRKLMEVGGQDIEYYLLYADTGNTARGGQGDEIYRKATFKNNTLVTDSTCLDVASNASNAGNTEFDQDSSKFLYFDNSKGRFITEDEWKTVHFEERFYYNACYDKYLPITSYEAVRMGFEKLPYEQAEYHRPEGVTNEIDKGSTHKYITVDGLEAIYELLVDVDKAEEAADDPNATKMLPLFDYPSIGPTFNYASNDWNYISDASIAHYFFDMLPFYWWGGIR